MKDIIKKRTLKLDGLMSQDQANELLETLSKVAGIREVKMEKHSNLLLKYDLMTVKLETIEKLLTQLDCTFADGYLQRFQRGWIYYMEENEYNNMKIVPHSCCEDPKGSFKK